MLRVAPNQGRRMPAAYPQIWVRSLVRRSLPSDRAGPWTNSSCTEFPIDLSALGSKFVMHHDNNRREQVRAHTASCGGSFRTTVLYQLLQLRVAGEDDALILGAQLAQAYGLVLGTSSLLIEHVHQAPLSLQRLRLVRRG